MTIDGQIVDFAEGETIYEVAERCRSDVPTLCYDPRLEAFGACRLCVVEVEGIKNPVASCTTKASPEMVVKTKTDEVEKHRKTLLELVASENRNVGDIDQLARLRLPGARRTCSSRYRVEPGRRFQGKQSGTSNTRRTRTPSSCATTTTASPATAACGSAPSRRATTRSQ